MLKVFVFCSSVLLFFSCKKESSTSNTTTETEIKNDTIRLDTVAKDFREFRVTDSKIINMDSLWMPFEKDLALLTKERYEELKPFILEKDIPTLQKYIAQEEFTYEELTLFYLYRIREFDRNNPKSLNAVISLNPEALKTARILDASEVRIAPYSIFGMPMLIKDNINTKELPTTAGAVALINNKTDDAFIIDRLREKGAIILGKANLSEWAYFFCGDCPSGYSAVGGQTFNPYGRRTIDTGGSSSGSGVAVAANFCVAAVGTETSGSILSPSSQNSVVGLKPTVGLLSRSGIIPISGTLDTPGPMAKSVTDAAIVLQSMVGIDVKDKASADSPEVKEFYVNGLSQASLKGKRFGFFKELASDSLYSRALDTLRSAGVSLIELEAPEKELKDFIRLLNLDMKKDLPAYFSKYGSKDLEVTTIEEIISYNKSDSMARSPYGQKLFQGIMSDTGTQQELEVIKDSLFIKGETFFSVPIKKHNLDAILSINNYHAGFAAVARYPAITVPMGYTKKNEPEGLTIITTPFNEEKLLQWAYRFEQVSGFRKFPSEYR